MGDVPPGQKTEIEIAVDQRIAAVEKELARDPKLGQRFRAEARALRIEFGRLRDIYRDRSPDTSVRSGGFSSLAAYEELMSLRDQAADLLIRTREPARAAPVTKATFDSGAFATQIRSMPDGRRIPLVERIAGEMAAEEGLVYDEAVSAINNRSVYRNPRTGDYRSVDTRHGAFHYLTGKGVDRGKYNFKGEQLDPPDKTGKHDIRL